MHDPKTVAFDIRWPFTDRQMLTIWHVDPEKDGSDDSCDWFNRGKSEDKADPRRLAVYEALWDMETILDNKPHYPDSIEHRTFQPLKQAIRDALKPKPRWWFQHPRWHFWHWELQIHFLQNIKRRYWDKCHLCGKRGFAKNVSAIGTWAGDKIAHSTCYESQAKCSTPYASTGAK